MKKTNQRLFYPQKVKRQLFCALVACAVCAIPVNAQSGTISLNKSNVSMHTIMQEVEGQSDYTFFYNDNQIKLDKKVSVKAQNATIEQVLAQMFKNSGYTYKVSIRPRACFFPLFSFLPLWLHYNLNPLCVQY